MSAHIAEPDFPFRLELRVCVCAQIAAEYLDWSCIHVRECPDYWRARHVSGVIAPLKLALAVRCGPLVVTLATNTAKSNRNAAKTSFPQ